MVEIVGAETRNASTLHSILNAISTLPKIYMIWLDGAGFRKFRTHGLLWTDAAANLLVSAIVVIVIAAYGLGLRRASTAQHLNRRPPNSRCAPFPKAFQPHYS